MFRLQSLSLCNRLRRRFIELLDFGVLAGVVVLDESNESDVNVWDALSLLDVVNGVDDELVEDHDVLLPFSGVVHT